MLIEAMQKIDGEGVAMFEAHADVEIFRIRLGRALDFEYHEGLSLILYTWWLWYAPRKFCGVTDSE